MSTATLPAPTATTPLELRSRDRVLDSTPDALGDLLDSSPQLGDTAALRANLERDGYLFLRDFLVRDDVLLARRVILETLARNGHGIDPAYPLMEARHDPNRPIKAADYRGLPAVTRENPGIVRLIAHGPLPELFRRLLGGEVRFFERIMLRILTPGPYGTPTHCDSVYMNRGTKQLYTAWTPLGDAPRTHGGLMVLERSHHIEKLRHEYSDLDVDAYCANHPDAIKWASGELRYKGWKSAADPLVWSGQLAEDPVALRRELGGRWLTTDYRTGDVLIFSIYTVHASLDNRSDRIRFSFDTRWQLASEPVDERWSGANPPGHSPEMLRGRIC